MKQVETEKTALKKSEGDGAVKREENGEDESDDESGMAELNLGFWKVRLPGRLLLLSVPLLWGSFGPAVRFLYGVEHAPRPSLFNAERLTLSAMVYTVVLWYQLSDTRKEQENITTDTVVKPTSSWVIGGIELGSYVFLANVAQVLGLQSVGAGRAAFLNQMQTVIVPALAFITRIEKSLSIRTILSSIVAIAGVSLLAADPNPDVVSSVKGDVLEVTSAFFFSLYILRINNYSKKSRVPLLVGSKIIVQALLAWIWALQSITTSQTTVHFVPDGGIKDVLSWAGVIAWTGLMSSALSGWVQTSAQKVVPPSEAAVIFASQPLIAAALSWLLLGEKLDLQAGIGGALIVGATAVSSIKPKRKKKQDATK
eukprot:Plantae.Rhodophyta-Purpureofilum_apyrenoidigerum.ctg6809.p1 GENE.Plantae.Rhodophyta-Purpureofilum_apyrenoidigerum.ctg6809~~Plantae.Rhodophyta-Purpureofilum_apyrenoidigerum.ctg6809.p1  ORF type:complete len:414 (-),score=64.08 Plantae.Rhodophyta-Purpureofilum_apyrenoidigerum.ctg6809:353-1459(-)